MSENVVQLIKFSDVDFFNCVLGAKFTDGRSHLLVYPETLVLNRVITHNFVHFFFLKVAYDLDGWERDLYSTGATVHLTNLTCLN